MIGPTSMNAELTRPRVLLFGLNNRTTAIVLKELLAHGVWPLALLLPDSAAPHLIDANAPYSIVAPAGPSLSIMALDETRHIADQAHAADLPVWVVRHLSADDTLLALAELSAEVGVVACFSRKIPFEVRERFAQGVFNIHPSLLPDYRGPSPLFWQFRAGETRTGVTVHRMDEGFDTGDILAQKAVSLPGGISEREADRMLTEAGVSIFVDALAGIGQRSATLLAQPPGGSTFGWPTDDDFAINPAWTARRAFDFMRSTAGWGRPYRIVVNGQALLAAEALAIDESDMTGAIYYESDSIAWIRLVDGAIQVRLV